MGQPSHGPPTTVDEAGLTCQDRPVVDDAQHVTAPPPQAATGHDDDFGAMAIELSDVPAQPTDGVGGVELSFDDDLAPDDVQASGEADRGRDLSLATARLVDLQPGQLVLHSRRHGH